MTINYFKELPLEVIIGSICVILAIVGLIVLLIKYLLAPRNGKVVIQGLRDVMINKGGWGNVLFPVIVTGGVYGSDVRYYNSLDEVVDSEVDPGLTGAKYIIDNNQNKYSINIEKNQELIASKELIYFYDSLTFDQMIHLSEIKKLILDTLEVYSDDNERAAAEEYINQINKSESLGEIINARDRLLLDV